jgi:hypothetical protein
VEGGFERDRESRTVMINKATADHGEAGTEEPHA